MACNTVIYSIFVYSGDHTEVVDIEYNPDVISYTQLLALFWQNHEYGLTTKIKRQVNVYDDFYYKYLIFNLINY